MVRTQISLTREQHEKLKKEARRRGVSMSELIREGVERVLQAPATGDRDEIVERAREAMGKYRSGKSDISVRHDKYLAEAYK